MLLMPKREWQWGYNDAYGVLSVSLGPEMEFLTPYKFKSLIPDAKIVMKFSVEHAKFYIDLVDRLSKLLSIDDALLVQMALNATAAHFLLNPQMPKSWFFETSHICVYSEVGKIFHLKTSHQTVSVLVIETGLQASLVMLLSEQCQLSENKSLTKFDTIKVMHNRLYPLRVHKQIVAA